MKCDHYSLFRFYKYCLDKMNRWTVCFTLNRRDEDLLKFVRRVDESIIVHPHPFGVGVVERHGAW
jgi:hypothetical protein